MRNTGIQTYAVVSKRSLNVNNVEFIFIFQLILNHSICFEKNHRQSIQCIGIKEAFISNESPLYK